MQLELKFYGIWAIGAGVSKSDIVLKDNQTVGELIDILSGKYGCNFKEASEHGYLYSKNADGRFRALNYEDNLENNSTLLFMGPIEGS